MLFQWGRGMTDAWCLPIVDIPRLFLGFPLVGTENFSFPAVINSFQFTATEHRDGVFLWQAEDTANVANQENQAVIEEACGLLAQMLRFRCIFWLEESLPSSRMFSRYKHSPG